MFYDEVTIRVRSGDGGNGCVSFRREKFVPRGGPDGGDGGWGGSVVLRGNRNVTTLLDIGRKSEYRAENGRPGMGKNRSGRRGRDMTLDVPIGTVVREVREGNDPRQGPLVGDIVEHGRRLRVARGGRGGKGNRAFATATNQVPRTAQDGQSGESRVLYLELKLLADVGLVGLPNAGKSTLLSRVSAATPKIAPYPFTTLQPHLGIVELGDFTRLVFADIPGLIEGAHLGHGLGTEFLRHIERTRVLVHLISAEDREVEELLRKHRVVEEELKNHSEALARTPRIVVLTKMDIVGETAREELRRALSDALGTTVLAISAVTGWGLEGLVVAARKLVSDTPRPSWTEI